VPPTEEWLCCLHEAGHVVAHLELGGTVIEAAVEGRTGWFKPRGIASAVTLMSGYVAEWRVTRPGETPDPDEFGQNWEKPDIRRASERIGSIDGDLLLAVWIEARRLIDDEWDSVLRIAEALKVRGHLSGEQAASLWRRARVAA
jgi:hypothetical protein